MESLSNKKAELEANSSVIIRDVFTKEEIAKLKKMIVEDESLLNGDLLSIDALRSLVSDDRILSILRTLLGTDELVYLCEGNATISKLSKQTMYPQGFHKDCTDRENGLGPDWQIFPFTIVRVAIYLQDHSKHSGGLSIYQGSHTRDSIGPDGKVITRYGKKVYMPTRVGDVAAWYFTTTHAGNWGLPRLKFLHELMPFKIQEHLHRLKFLFYPKFKERAAIFMAFGVKNSPALERYKKYLRIRDFGWLMYQNANHSPELIEWLKKEKNLEVFDLKEIMQGVKKEDVGKHKEIPFETHNH
jgi:hypothetical protein